MSTNYFSLNHIFLEVILILMICRGQNQFADEPTEIKLPFDGQCSAGNGSFTFFNVDFRFSKFRELLLAETTNNKCLTFLFCYENSSEFVKPQFKIVNNNSNEIWNLCMENWHGFNIVFCLNDHETLELSISFSFIQEEMRKLVKFHSKMNFFRIQFQTKNVRIFYQIDDDEKMEELNVTEYGDTEQQNFSLYNGNKMLQKNSYPWHILLDLAFSTAGHLRIHHHHPKECMVPKANSTNQTISIECKDLSCEFDISNEEQCGKRCRTKLTEEHHHREALISRGQSVIDTTKWPWMVAMKMTFAVINEHGEEISESSSRCTGAIIHCNYVLTAAHCIVKEIPHRNGQIVRKKLLGVKIYAGHFDISNPTVQIIEEKPATVIVHENSEKYYLKERFLYMDVALIKLSQPLKFNENIRSICLANFELRKDKIVHIAGWGFKEEMDHVDATRPSVREDEEILHESVAKIIDNGECLSVATNAILEFFRGNSEEELQKIVKIQKEISKASYCLQGIDNSTIQMGDSGSPMMASINGTWFTFGIASMTFLRESLNDTPLPFYYTKIDGQLCDWIKIKTEGKVHCSDF